MKTIGLLKFLPGFAWFFIVLVLLCMPGNDIPEVSWLGKIHFDKWVHCGVFCLLALLFMLPVSASSLDKKRKYGYILWILVITSAWGLSTEFIQKFLVTGREFDLWDWAADSLGALLAFLYCRKKYLKPA